MKYFVTFKNEKVNCSWERETENEHPSYIKKEDIVELTQEQYDNRNYLSLSNKKIVIDTEKKDKNLAKKNKHSIEKQIADWCEAKGKREAYYFRLTKTTSEYIEYKEFCESIGA